MSTEQQDYRLAAILVAGVPGYQSLAERDEEAAARRVQFAQRIVERHGSEWAGSIVPSSGSSIVAEFASVAGAVQAALAIQKTLVREAREGVDLRLRVGIHSGDVWFIRGDIIGEGVDVASRLQSLASAGGVCLSETVYAQVKQEMDFPAVTDLGMADLSDLKRKIRVFEIPAARRSPSRAENPDDGGNSLTQRIMRRLEGGGGRVSAQSLEDLLAGGRSRLKPILESLAEKGVLTRITTSDGKIEYAAAYHRQEVREASSNLRDEEAIEEKELTLRAGLRAHATSFLVVNAGLTLGWFVWTGPGGHPWFLYPLGAWAIGLASHWVNWMVGRRHRREQRAPLTREQRRLLKKIQKGESAWADHLTAYISTNTFLLVINYITSWDYLWFLFPLVGWFVGLWSHRAVYRLRRRSLTKRLKRLGLNRRTLKAVPVAPPKEPRHQRLVDEADQVRRSITHRLEESEHLKRRWGDELEPLLAQYVGQIAQLNKQSAELDAILVSTPGQTLSDEIAAMRARRETAPSASVREEYDRSIGQAEQQQRSLEELHNQKEILDLRLKSSVIALKKLEMDFARMKGLETSGERFAMQGLREKSKELSQYLEDLGASYTEID